VFWSIAGLGALSRTAGGTAVFGFMPVVPMTIISALLMIVVSRLTSKPSRETINRYFPEKRNRIGDRELSSTLKAPVA
jgi:hypothetical protein